MPFGDYSNLSLSPATRDKIHQIIRLRVQKQLGVKGGVVKSPSLARVVAEAVDLLLERESTTQEREAKNG